MTTANINIESGAVNGVPGTGTGSVVLCPGGPEQVHLNPSDPPNGEMKLKEEINEIETLQIAQWINITHNLLFHKSSNHSKKGLMLGLVKKNIKEILEFVL
eukprot:c21436_g1_i2.p1 GENE.c21436_g1_i2~~c21436_g1_i2.p1  ORF type:complete len:101 (-),score=24.04 c21436_g1_i2:337-639(-)